jgi:hypothetical protein
MLSGGVMGPEMVGGAMGLAARAGDPNESSTPTVKANAICLFSSAQAVRFKGCRPTSLPNAAEHRREVKLLFEICHESYLIRQERLSQAELALRCTVFLCDRKQDFRNMVWPSTRASSRCVTNSEDARLLLGKLPFELGSTRGRYPLEVIESDQNA